MLKAKRVVKAVVEYIPRMVYATEISRFWTVNAGGEITEMAFDFEMRGRAVTFLGGY